MSRMLVLQDIGYNTKREHASMFRIIALFKDGSVMVQCVVILLGSNSSRDNCVLAFLSNTQRLSLPNSKSLTFE